MSKNSTDDLFESHEATEANKPAKKAAKKVAAKKAPAKKAARKVAKKAPTAETPAPAQEKPAEPAAKPAAKPKPIEAPTLSLPNSQDQPQSKSEHSDDSRENQRIGRVPGGGRVNHGNHDNSGNNSNSENPSRAKKRRDKRKRRRDHNDQEGGARNDRLDRNDRNDRNDRPDRQEERAPAVLTGPITEADGIIEMTPKGFGFLRLADTNFEQAKEDIFISPELIRNHALRHGQWLHGKHQDSSRGPQLIEVTMVNDMPPADAAKLPHFDELKAINPNKRIAFETTPDRYTTRVIDIVAPVGRGQRGLIVSPPRSGKTTLLLHMAEAIREKYDEQIHLMILLVDERPEEVTEFRRALPGAEIYASSNDEASRNHTRIAELAIERAKRLVEAGKDVFLLMDSITRLARAYNGAMSSGGKGRRGRATGSGGITIGALEVPRRLFAAARNTREGGSLTILATALIQTNSRADEAIFMEFKGTGNMELVLDRKIAESYIYPAVDIFKSGTRREELLLAEHTLHKIHLIRRGLSGHRPYEAMERLLYFIKKFPNNPQMLLEIKG
jgi:transcription termination factor Rho